MLSCLYYGGINLIGSLDVCRIVCSQGLVRHQDCCAMASNTTIFTMWCTLAAHPGMYCISSGHSCVPLPAAEYLARDLGWAVNDDSWKCLWSPSHKVFVSAPKWKVGDRIFIVAAPWVWNGLPLDVVTVQSSSAFTKTLQDTSVLFV